MPAACQQPHQLGSLASVGSSQLRAELRGLAELMLPGHAVAQVRGVQPRVQVPQAADVVLLQRLLPVACGSCLLVHARLQDVRLEDALVADWPVGQLEPAV